MAHMTYTWHEDAKGSTKPHEYVGNTYLHVKSATLYTVVGYGINASSDCWCFHYKRTNPEARMPDFTFTRDMHEFLHGDRFLLTA